MAEFEMPGIAKMINDAINIPLTRGLMDKPAHDLYKKDMYAYYGMLSEGRTVEAAAFLKKTIEKYDTPKTDGV